jgi:anti-sigma factor RsiW
MRRDRFLAVVSAAQITTGVTGLVLALRRHYAYHFLFLRGRPDRVACDAIGMGTALSAPVPMLVAQATGIVVLRRSRSRWAVLMLTALGAAMVPGYMGEALVRERLRNWRHHPIESALVASASGLAATMAIVGRPLVSGRPGYASLEGV